MGVAAVVPTVTSIQLSERQWPRYRGVQLGAAVPARRRKHVQQSYLDANCTASLSLMHMNTDGNQLTAIRPAISVVGFEGQFDREVGSLH